MAEKLASIETKFQQAIQRAAEEQNRKRLEVADGTARNDSPSTLDPDVHVKKEAMEGDNTDGTVLLNIDL